MLLVNKIVSSIMEMAIICFIPFIWWIITSKKEVKFFNWIGLRKIENNSFKKSIVGIIVVSTIYVIISFLTLMLVKDIETATSEFTGLGVKGIFAALVYAIFNTSLPEEIFFRGFILKRLQNKFGYNIANIIQSILFGLLHGVMFFSIVGVIKALIVILFTGTVAYVMGYINEKKAGGSILPSWIIHATSNIFASFIALFSII